MALEEEDIHSFEPNKPLSRARRLAYPSTTLILATLIPGFALILYVLETGWSLHAPPYSSNWHVEFYFQSFLTPLAAAFLVPGVAFSVGYFLLWFRRPKWNAHLVAAFSAYAVLFGIGLSVVVLLFAFVFPTGFTSGSGHEHDQPILLLASLPLLSAGIYGLIMSRRILSHPILANPSDTRDAPNHLTRRGWILTGGTVLGCIAVFGILVSPAVSPLSYVHDGDRDGKSDKVDHFPNDANLWAPVHLILDINETEDAFILTFMGALYGSEPLPLSDFYLSTYERHYDGTLSYSIILDRVSLSGMASEGTRGGVSFIDNQQTGFLSSTDILQFDKSTYERLDKCVLSDASSGVIYGDWVLEAF